VRCTSPVVLTPEQGKREHAHRETIQVQSAVSAARNGCHGRRRFRRSGRRVAA
jgi:hypothetical protein